MPLTPLHRQVTEIALGAATAADLVEAALREAGFGTERQDLADTITGVISFARRLDPGLEDRDFADAGSRLDRWGDHVFAAFALSPADIAQLRRQFTHWPRRRPRSPS